MMRSDGGDGRAICKEKGEESRERQTRRVFIGGDSCFFVSHNRKEVERCSPSWLTSVESSTCGTSKHLIGLVHTMHIPCCLLLWWLRFTEEPEVFVRTGALHLPYPHNMYLWPSDCPGVVTNHGWTSHKIFELLCRVACGMKSSPAVARRLKSNSERNSHLMIHECFKSSAQLYYKTEDFIISQHIYSSICLECHHAITYFFISS